MRHSKGANCTQQDAAAGLGDLSKAKQGLLQLDVNVPGPTPLLETPAAMFHSRPAGEKRKTTERVIYEELLWDISICDLKPPCNVEIQNCSSKSSHQAVLLPSFSCPHCSSPDFPVSLEEVTAGAWRGPSSPALSQLLLELLRLFQSSCLA